MLAEQGVDISYEIFYVQHHLISRNTLRQFRDEAMDVWDATLGDGAIHISVCPGYMGYPVDSIDNRLGDAKPAECYDGSGAYMVAEDDSTMIYKCERWVRMIHMHSDYEEYPMRIVSLEWFDERVTALVVGIGRSLEKV